MRTHKVSRHVLFGGEAARAQRATPLLTEQVLRFPHVFLSLFRSPIGGVTARAAELSIFRVDPGPGVSHRQRLRHPVCSDIRLSIHVLSSQAYRAFDRTIIYLGGWVNTGSPRKKTPLRVRQRMKMKKTLSQQHCPRALVTPEAWL